MSVCQNFLQCGWHGSFTRLINHTGSSGISDWVSDLAWVKQVTQVTPIIISGNQRVLTNFYNSGLWGNIFWSFNKQSIHFTRQYYCVIAWYSQLFQQAVSFDHVSCWNILTNIVQILKISRMFSASLYRVRRSFEQFDS